jgi:hypothetical protein
MVDVATSAKDTGGASAPPGFHELEMGRDFNWDQQRDLINNLKVNLQRDVPTLKYGKKKNGRFVICGGAPSLADNIENVKKIKGRIVAMNDSAKFLRDNGVKAWGNVWWEVEWNRAATITSPVDDIKYIIASQAHPTTFDTVKDKDVLMWHVLNDAGEQPLIAKYDPKGVMLGGGCTAALRCINMGMVMGYKKFDLFGIDSSSNGDTHAYYDSGCNNWIDVLCAGETFRTQPFYARQARDFTEFMTLHGDTIDVRVWGEGLIPHIARQFGVHEEQKREK